MDGKGKLRPLRTDPSPLRENDPSDNKNKAQADHQTDSVTKSIKSPSRERGLRSDSHYGSYPEGTSLREREITAEIVKIQPVPDKVDARSPYQTDQLLFDNALSTTSRMLIRYHAHHSRNTLPFWIQFNRYPVRQFRAYQLENGSVGKETQQSIILC
ncbi:hypothetical protein [Endozoicomonas sp. 2B-B]